VKRKIRLLYLLLFCFTFTLSLSAQNFTKHNWLFSNDVDGTSLHFGKEIGSDPILESGKITLSNIGEKLTISDPTTGDLLFYSDGTNIYDASHSIMLRGDGLFFNSSSIQGMSASPVPGIANDSSFYVFTRDNAGEIFYTTVNMNAQGNRADGPKLGEVVLGERNQATGITNKGDGMITIGSRDMTRFWLITQNTTGLFEVYSIEEGGVFTSVSNFGFSATVNSIHLAYNNITSRIAVVPSNDVNIQVLRFNEGTEMLEAELEFGIPNSFVLNEIFGGSAGWSPNGSKLFFGRNGTVDGNIYRYDFNDSFGTVLPILRSNLAESLSLMVAPDSSVYNIYRATTGGNRILGRINNADLDLASIDYELDVFQGQDFNSNYFQQFLPEKRIAPTVDFVFQEPCLNNPMLFLPIITPPEATPTTYNWDFQGAGQSNGQLAPIVTFDQAGMVNARLTVAINGVNYMSPSHMITIAENDLEVQLQDTTICPGEVLELDAEPEGQGGAGSIGTDTNTYRWSTGETSSAINVTEAGDYWVVVTPQNGCAVYSSAEVTVYGDENPTANIWYFGNGAGIDFNDVDGLDPPPRSIINPHAMNAPEGTSTISDANGDVLFYTDGETVYNNLNEVMLDGDSIGGDILSNQSVIIVPFYDDETLYYVFTTQEIYGSNEYRLKYSVVDMKGGDGLGAVTVKDQILFTKSTEKLAAFEAGGGHWLLAHEYGSNSFRAYAITADGISPPVISSKGSIHSLNDPMSGQAGMKFSSGGNRIAVALIDGIDDYVEFFQFDVTTGEVTELEYVIDLNEGSPANDEVYDVHFSQGGNKIFATMNNRNTGSPGGRVLEYRIDTFSTEITRQTSKEDIADGFGGSVNYGGIQTGPDGQIYVAVEDPGNPSATAFVSAIAATEDTLNASSFNLQQVILTTGNSRLGLPNFVQNSMSPMDEPSMNARDTTCVEERLQFSATGTSDIDQYLWTIQDSLNNVVFSALAQDTAYTFPVGQSGDFELSLNIFNRCGYDTTFVQNLAVFDIPPTPTVPSALILCEGDTNLLTAGPLDPNLSYEWTNSQGTVVSTTNTFDVTEQEIYTVTITNNVGGACTSSREFFAGPPFEITLPPDVTICQNDPFTLDPNVTADNYIWTIINPDNSSVTLPNQRIADVDSSVPGLYQYIVSIEDPITPGCFANDTTNVTINPIPLISQTGGTPTVCGDENGTIDLLVSTTGSYTYTVFDNAATVVPQPSNTVTGPGPINITALGAGVYSVIIRDNSSGCINSINSLEVINSNADISIMSSSVSTQPSCADPDGVITVTLNAVAVFPVSYTLTNTSDPTAPVISGSNISSNSPANDFLIDPVPGGLYDLEVTSAGGCIDTETGITVNTPTEIVLTITSPADVCGTSINLNDYVISTPVATLTWVDANGDPVPDPTIVTASGIYTVTANGSGAFCDTIGNLEVNLTIQPEVIINRIGDVCTGTLTLEAEITNPQAGANYSYTWSTGEQTSQITVGTDGTYDVLVREAGVLNCPSALVAETVAIPVPMEAVLSSTPPCDDGQPFTITAEILAGSPTGYSWTHNGNPYLGNTNIIVASDEGNYTVTISQGGCNIERSISIQRNAIPEGLLPDEDFYCPTSDTNPILVAGNGFSTFVWTLDGAPYNNTTATLEVQAPGLYEVTMTTAQGCVRFDSVNIIESCDPQIILPNVFIPGGNSPNDVFFAYPNDFVANFQIFIYTRWGELIYQSSSTDFNWDGTYAGNIVPVGTYPYVIKYTSKFEPGKGEFEQSGGVLVLR
jgi:gliding motility-associated-like protein